MNCDKPDLTARAAEAERDKNPRSAKREGASAITPHKASQVFAAPMSLKSTPPFALSSFADSTMVMVTALGSTL